MTDMPGAPCAWVADTFTNLTQNIIPTVLESLERKGYKEGVHYIVEQAPPTFNDIETINLPKWLQSHFWKPRNRLISYKRTIIFYTGMNLTFGSLDRPSTLAGRSFVHIFGDEGKYFKESKIANMLKANRGYPEYSYSVYYMGVTFTSDVADPSNVGEYAWISKQAANINVESLTQLIKVGLVYNSALGEYIASKDVFLNNKTEENRKACLAKLKVVNLWRSRWITLRKQNSNHTFYIRASSYVNADILTAEWFAAAIDSKLPDLNTAILSMRPTIKAGDKFYAAISNKHFYFDGINEKAYNTLSLRDKEDCNILKYIQLDKPLRLGVDFGNMCSMTIGQEEKVDGINHLRIIKFIYTLAPEYIEDLGLKFREYFAPMRKKMIYLYYDRAGNAYKKVGKSQIGDLKRAIEIDGTTGQRTGWTVQLMSLNQSTITQAQEYDFMMKLFSRSVKGLPAVLIDYYACKALRLSLLNAKTKVQKGIIYKNKSSERLPIEDLPFKSTNPSDSFKYFAMSKDLMAIATAKTALNTSILDPSII